MNAPTGQASPFLSMGPSSVMIQQQQPMNYMMGDAPAQVQQQVELSPMEQQLNQERLHLLVSDLLISEKREAALAELSKDREKFAQLAPTLWNATGVMTALLQEIVSVYDLLQPPTLSASASNRVCNALALFQSVSSHNDTRSLFLNAYNCLLAHIPLFLYPFLNTIAKTRAFEYLRLTSLGVIGALVKSDDVEVIRFLLSTEIIPLCLRIMETGTELSKTVATFIVQKILIFQIGLTYICATPERFYAVSTVLGNMVNDKPSARLLKHIVRCYLRLSDHPRAKDALRQCLPDSLRDKTFDKHFQSDQAMKRWLLQLLMNVGDYASYHEFMKN
ncbi:CCR4-NOT transcription complex subunit 9 [Acrasis kona]|uniref:CCR4-NOT transcription complex subunit 9 n=1 Tax=Acrasis kona TaxID=1008807 RepID=A0AAW2Z4P8_9EUKA